MTDLTPDETRRLRDAVAALPESVEPERDLWPDIRARIEAGRVVPLPREERHERAPRGPRVSWPQLAAVAAVLVLASVALTRWMTEPAVPTMAVAPAMDSAGTARALASYASFERTTADLSATLERRAAQLDPATRAVLERSLRTIDQAIAEAREALAADPASAAMRGFVESAYRQKVDFLRRANDVAALRGT